MTRRPVSDGPVRRVQQRPFHPPRYYENLCPKHRGVVDRYLEYLGGSLFPGGEEVPEPESETGESRTGLGLARVPGRT